MANQVYTTSEIDEIIKSIDDRIQGIIIDNAKLWKQLQQMEETFASTFNEMQQKIVDLLAYKDKLAEIKETNGVTSPYAH